MIRRRPVIALALAAVIASAAGLWAFRQPLRTWIAGEASVMERRRGIAARHPELGDLRFTHLRLLAFKDPGVLEVQLDGVPWRRFPFTARSGGPGPKLREGDRQIPEGLYRIDAVNPASAYHLSLRVSYPNADDRARSAALGIADPGGDIYIHGKAVSIGCIAIGDDAIEQVFQAVTAIDPATVEVLILPWDLRRRPPPAGGDAALYARLAAVLRAWAGP
jgi:hypothetical protein